MLDSDINHFNALYPDMNNDDICRYYSFNEFNSSVVGDPDDLTIFHLNICSLLNKWDELLNNLGMLNISFNFVCITETWLSSDDPLGTLNMSGYTPFHLHREGRGGGVSVFVNSSFHCKKLEQFSMVNENIESLIVEVCLNNMIVVFCTVYRPPHGSIDIFLRLLIRYCRHYQHILNVL